MDDVDAGYKEDDVDAGYKEDNCSLSSLFLIKYESQYISPIDD